MVKRTGIAMATTHNRALVLEETFSVRRFGKCWRGGAGGAGLAADGFLSSGSVAFALVSAGVRIQRCRFSTGRGSPVGGCGRGGWRGPFDSAGAAGTWTATGTGVGVDAGVGGTAAEVPRSCSTLSDPAEESRKASAPTASTSIPRMGTMRSRSPLHLGHFCAGKLFPLA
jgi:hypothetical protein